MNDVSNYDATFWHFQVKIYAKLIGRQSLERKTLELTKLLQISPNWGDFSLVCDDASNYRRRKQKRSEVNVSCLGVHGEKQKQTNKALIKNAMLNKWNSSLIDIVENAVIIS